MNKISQTITMFIFIMSALSIDASNQSTTSEKTLYIFEHANIALNKGLIKPCDRQTFDQINQKLSLITRQDDEFAATLSPERQEAYKKFKKIKIDETYEELSLITRRDDEFIAMLSPKQQTAYEKFKKLKIDKMYA